MEFSRQEHWSELPFPSLGELPNPGIKPLSPAGGLAGGFFTTEPQGKPKNTGVGSLSFLQQIFLTQSPSWWCTPCSAKMDAREDSGRWLDMWCLLLTFPELFQLVEAY